MDKDKLEEKENIIITVTNNKKKSLKKSKLIVNFDFEEEELKKYTKKHLKKYPFCTKMKINIKKGTCVLF